MMPDSIAPCWYKRLAVAAFWLGFALSGFFDGILLHQVLQWHHLLSGLQGGSGPFSDLRFQVLADGYFHTLMYAVAAVALWLLWRWRQAFELKDASRVLLGWLLIGFGVWHFVDGMVSHWITQIHRIKMDADNPLLWDIGWLVMFGAIPFAIGWWMRSRGGAGPSLKNNGPAAIALLAFISTASGAWASQHPPGQKFTTVVFAPWMTFDEGLQAIQEVGYAEYFFSGDGVFVIGDGALNEAWQLYGRGALLVSGAAMPPGCFGWTRA